MSFIFTQFYKYSHLTNPVLCLIINYRNRQERRKQNVYRNVRWIHRPHPQHQKQRDPQLGSLLQPLLWALHGSHLLLCHYWPKGQCGIRAERLFFYAHPDPGGPRSSGAGWFFIIPPASHFVKWKLQKNCTNFFSRNPSVLCNLLGADC